MMDFHHRVSGRASKVLLHCGLLQHTVLILIMSFSAETTEYQNSTVTDFSVSTYE